MKGFIITNNNIDDWKEVYRKNACEVVDFVKENKIANFSIFWKSPLYKSEDTKLLQVESGKITYKNDVLEIPKTILNICK